MLQRDQLATYCTCLKSGNLNNWYCSSWQKWIILCQTGHVLNSWNYFITLSSANFNTWQHLSYPKPIKYSLVPFIFMEAPSHRCISVHFITRITFYGGINNESSLIADSRMSNISFSHKAMSICCSFFIAAKVNGKHRSHNDLAHQV